jgi:replicative DNA helicase
MRNKDTHINEENAIYGKLPPQALEVEKAVLGALMLERDAFETVSEIIDTHSFYKDEHQKIFQVIKELSANKKPIDLLTVTQELKDRNLLDEIGGPLFITQLTQRVASVAHLESHARIIADKYYLRESIRKASLIINEVYSGEDVETISNEWKESYEDLEDVFIVADTGTPFKGVLKKTLMEIEKDCARISSGETPGIPTGLVGLDECTGGWKNGNLIVLAARPGIGKTSLALYFALEAAKAKFWVNIFSLEVNKEDLARILIASESGVYRSNIRDGYLQSDDWQQINKAIGKIENLPILFRDAAGMTVNQIKGAIHKNKKNGKCDIAIVDYLQLVRSSQSRTIRELEVSEISRTLKTSALAENIPILALSQLNREADGIIPKLSHLRESGAIEQDADIVCFLHPKDQDNRTDQDNGILSFIIAKHRRGKIGTTNIYHNQEMTKFSEFPITNNKSDFNF